jgi:hypothetical protein
MTTKTQQKSGCLNTILRFVRDSDADGVSDESLPYHLRDDFLSPAELSFYRVLSTVISNRAVIFTKVRLADIFFVARPNENRSYFGRISQRHIDFLLCEPNTAKPIVGIELDDSSHNRSSRKKRDEFVDQVFETTQLPLVRIPVQQTYTTQEVLGSVEQYFETDETGVIGSDAPEVEEVSDPAQAKISSTPLCPKCGIPMVIRTVKKGKHQGKQFFGCENYPNCREMLPIESS